MGWERPILTDSGGYQVMSLSELTKRERGGRRLQAAISTASRHLLSPERSMEIQRLLGSDIVMAFDELVPTTSTARGAGRGDGAVDALGEAHRATAFDARRRACRAAPRMFGIQQGALDEELRAERRPTR